MALNVVFSRYYCNIVQHYRAGCEAYKTILTNNVTIRISAQSNFILLLKHFITKVLDYKASLKGRIKFVCVAMCSLVMSLCSCDLHMTYT